MILIFKIVRKNKFLFKLRIRRTVENLLKSLQELCNSSSRRYEKLKHAHLPVLLDNKKKRKWVFLTLVTASIQILLVDNRTYLL